MLLFSDSVTSFESVGVSRSGSVLLRLRIRKRRMAQNSEQHSAMATTAMRTMMGIKTNAPTISVWIMSDADTDTDIVDTVPVAKVMVCEFAGGVIERTTE